ncbi:MAG TPA: GNAT family N-acetyltransferase [Ktedonobacteraceae bacterium]|jgi:ribosomal protein S18 acetylase RimI-like enzyme
MCPLFAQKLFFGAYEGAHLVAAGGTHVLAHHFHLTVPGAILTAPDAGRQGYATAITTALVAQLFARSFSLVVLNVVREDDDAQRVYRRPGFQVRHRPATGRSTA